MFSSKRYLTKGVQVEIPLVLQLFLWSCIDRLPEERDYFQVFKLEIVDGLQKITHFSEQPEYQKEYRIPTDFPINAKVYVIDSEEYSIMLLAEEYEPKSKPSRFHPRGQFLFLEETKMEEKIYCEHYGAVIAHEDDVCYVGDEVICSACTENTITCEHCGERIWDCDNYGDDNTYLCRSCYENHYTRCAESSCLLLLDTNISEK